MFTVQQHQWDGLLQFRQLVNEATYELAGSIETGFMSDSKSAVFSVRDATTKLELPGELATQLNELGQNAWTGVTSGDGVNSDSYTRAAVAMGVMGKIERLLDSITVAQS